MADDAPPISYEPKARSTPKRFKGLIAWAVAGLICVIGGITVFLLSQPKAHRDSPRAYSASHLHQIGLAILLFQNDHDGHYPDSTGGIASEGLDPGVFVSPLSNDTAGQWNKPTTQQAAAVLALPGRCSYVYLGHAGWTDATTPADAVVAYDPPANAQGEGSNILLGDGHVEWIANPRADRLIKAASATTRPVSAGTVR